MWTGKTREAVRPDAAVDVFAVLRSSGKRVLFLSVIWTVQISEPQLHTMTNDTLSSLQTSFGFIHHEILHSGDTFNRQIVFIAFSNRFFSMSKHREFKSLCLVDFQLARRHTRTTTDWRMVVIQKTNTQNNKSFDGQKSSLRDPLLLVIRPNRHQRVSLSTICTRTTLTD